MNTNDLVRLYADEFAEKTKGLSYIRRGVFWSELLAFFAFAKAHKVERIVESGTGLGFSASVLARLFPEVVTIGMEERPANLPSNVTFERGDSWEIAHEHITDGCAFLIDGPKHGEAVLMAEEVEAFSADRPAIIAIHDCARGMPARAAMIERFEALFFTDDPAFVAEFGHLDRECLDMAASRGKTFPDHGPTLGIVVL